MQQRQSISPPQFPQLTNQKSYKVSVKDSTQFLRQNPDRTEKLGKQFQKGKLQLASDILKSLNFFLNPSLHKKKQIKTIGSGISSFEQKNSYQQPCTVTRNILEIRKRNKMAEQNRSLQSKPHLKQSKSVKKGTISILQNNDEARGYLSQKYKDFVYTGKGEYSEKGKDKLRLQVVKWFMETKQDIIQALNESKDLILDWVQYVKYIKRDEFDIIIHAVGIKKDRNLLSRLFWLFDLNGDDIIDFNELQYSINLFREYSLDDKVNVFFELCDDNDDGFFDEEDLKRFFYKNLTNEEEARTMKFVLHDFYQELNPKNTKGVTKDELHKATLSDPNIRMIVEKNTRILKTSNKKDDDNGVYNINNLLFSGQYEGKNGIFFPHIETLMKAVAERELLIDTHQNLKIDQKKQGKYASQKEYSEDSDAQSDL